jgi:hypothetical protein
MLWKTYRDQLTLFVFVVLIAFLGYCVVTDKGAEIIIGAIIAWIGNIVQFYYRKSGPAQPTETTETK